MMLVQLLPQGRELVEPLGVAPRSTDRGHHPGEYRSGAPDWKGSGGSIALLVMLPPCSPVYCAPTRDDCLLFSSRRQDRVCL